MRGKKGCKRHFFPRFFYRFFSILCAQSANTTMAEARIHVSLMTNLPAPVSTTAKIGHPSLWCGDEERQCTYRHEDD